MNDEGGIFASLVVGFHAQGCIDLYMGMAVVNFQE